MKHTFQAIRKITKANVEKMDRQAKNVYISRLKIPSREKNV